MLNPVKDIDNKAISVYLGLRFYEPGNSACYEREDDKTLKLFFMSYAEKVSGRLNGLLEKNNDTEKGYRYAAENVSDPGLKSFFNERAQERYDFGHELKSEIRSFGEPLENGSSIKGDMQRSWMNLKATFTSNKEEAVLEETVRGEKAAVDEYNEVLKDQDIPPSTKNILIKQRNAITEALNRVKSLAQRESHS